MWEEELEREVAHTLQDIQGEIFNQKNVFSYDFIIESYFNCKKDVQDESLLLTKYPFLCVTKLRKSAFEPINQEKTVRNT